MATYEVGRGKKVGILLCECCNEGRVVELLDWSKELSERFPDVDFDRLVTVVALVVSPRGLSENENKHDGDEPDVIEEMEFMLVKEFRGRFERILDAYSMRFGVRIDCPVEIEESECVCGSAGRRSEDPSVEDDVVQCGVVRGDVSFCEGCGVRKVPVFSASQLGSVVTIGRVLGMLGRGGRFFGLRLKTVEEDGDDE